MRAYDIIKKKRDRQPLFNEEIAFLISGYTEGSIADYQMSAFAMAVFFNGMLPDELAAFTDAMLHSGEVVDLSHITSIKVDKHSTGGVGDKISLPLAPAVAACGVPVPMISGRGLGHTGGTLDKLESIPGFKVDLTSADYIRLVEENGCCLIGQTATVAPADKKLYALRDVTATVDCIPLIASSIMSKKMAEGIDALVLDVKFGSGAFMKSIDDATALARTMVDIGTRMNREVVARLTNMDQPLGRMIGNALEVQESIDVLEGGGPADVVELTCELGAEMLVMGKVAKDLAEGRASILASFKDGSAKEKFRDIIIAQGGEPKVLDDRSLLPGTSGRAVYEASESGVVKAVDTESLGIASVLLGGGRARSEDKVDPRVGLEVLVRIGDRIEKGQPLVTLHTADVGVDAALDRLKSAFSLTSDEVQGPALFATRITKEDL
ncbi:MAG: thymidine phosphorylase [Deltaproteobacteria bacterium]|nr:thymidine phosphorylase [Deltaproteobacteria bacterium]